MSAISYISVKDLSAKLRAGEPVVVVDVRDDDRAGGHIKGSTHVPAYDFKRAVPHFLSLWAAKDAVVFHCMMSQMRGPSCARAFANAAEEAAKTSNVDKMPQVMILEGGFREFARSFSEESKDLFEDYQPELYDAVWERD